jgi:hypothetical protein
VAQPLLLAAKALASRNHGMQFGYYDTKTGKFGWKGRGIWATYSSYLPKFTETKLGPVDHIQIRPNPLAK